MSFFRVLLALLISGGIAYGLYTVSQMDMAGGASQTEVVAERAEIADTSDTVPATDATQEEDSSSEPAAQAASGDASFTERTAEAVESTDAPAADGDEATTSTLAALPRPPEAPQASDAGATETGTTTGSDQTETAMAASTTLPATDISAATSESIAALDIVTGGMTYGEARETLIGAGWTPRALEERDEALNATETVLINAGYTEVEGCSNAERAICRFEFVDGQKRIAAVLTAGSNADPSVIDAFLMDIAKTE